MIYRYEDAYGEKYAIGVGTLIKAPNYKEGTSKKGKPYKLCTMTAEVDRHFTGDHTPEGYPKMENELLTLSAFGDVAQYCSTLKKKGIVMFVGRLVVDEYWTERATDGNQVFKLNVDFISGQPEYTLPVNEYGEYEGDLPEGWDEPDF